MGQKCNPTGLRIGVIKNWDSRWYAKKGEFGDTLVEDYKLRNYLLESLHGAGVPKVEIERDAKRVRINIHCAKPGMVIGKQGAEIEKLKAVCAKKLGKDANEVFINIVEIKQPDLNATLVAQSVAQQLERRVSFRRAVKGAIRNTMRLGARGIKIMVSGRIGGAEIARSETYKEGAESIEDSIVFAGSAEIGMNINNHIGLMLRQDNNRAETAPPKSAASGTAIASEGVAVRGTPIINNALTKTANI